MSDIEKQAGAAFVAYMSKSSADSDAVRASSASYWNDAIRHGWNGVTGPWTAVAEAVNAALPASPVAVAREKFYEAAREARRARLAQEDAYENERDTGKDFDEAHIGAHANMAEDEALIAYDALLAAEAAERNSKGGA